jgi:hypothetical protein
MLAPPSKRSSLLLINVYKFGHRKYTSSNYVKLNFWLKYKFGATTISITTLIIATLSITVLSIGALNITVKW